MLNASSCPMQSTVVPKVWVGKTVAEEGPPSTLPPVQTTAAGSDPFATFDDESYVEWNEEDIVFLHWRLLKDVRDLSDPETPLDAKFDTLRWIFTEREKESQPFSFVNCLKVVGCSPLSPVPYVGLVDAEEMRDAIRVHVKTWINATLQRYPAWVRAAVLHHPDWVDRQLAKNPQWLNEQIKKRSVQGDLFL